MKSSLFRKALPAFATSLSASALMIATPSWAKLSAEEIKSLGTSLTPMGAEKEGNKDGTIPAYSGKWLGAPPGVNFGGTGHPYPDPYASEKPLFVITAQNVAQYADRLTEGEKALFKKYPATFRMPVYPSHRDFRYPDKVFANVKENAATAELSDGGLVLKGSFGGPAFPIPKSGIELLWNTQTVVRSFNEVATYDQAVVYPDGNIAWGRVAYKIMSPVNNQSLNRKSFEGAAHFFNITTLVPERDKGSIIVGNETTDFANHPRQSWQYNPGTRRVRQLPSYGFDMPNGAGGFRTVDDDRLFNGSPERYDWKIVGKKEIYIPYNANKLDDPKLKYSDMLTKSHINPDLMRYELHRVWIVEGTVKQGMRHQYAKRVMYADEDTWNPVLADNYDSRGQLWRVSMLNFVYAYDLQGYQARVALFHDLLSGAYMADRLANEQKPARINTGELKEGNFTAESARQDGL